MKFTKFIFYRDAHEEMDILVYKDQMILLSLDLHPIQCQPIPNPETVSPRHLGPFFSVHEINNMPQDRFQDRVLSPDLYPQFAAEIGLQSLSLSRSYIMQFSRIPDGGSPWVRAQIGFELHSESSFPLSGLETPAGKGERTAWC